MVKKPTSAGTGPVDPIAEEEIAMEGSPAPSVEKKSKTSGTARFVGVGVFFVTVVAGSLYYSISSVDEIGPSALPNVPRLDTTPGGAVQAESQVFQEAIQRANLEGAEEAAQAGGSFVPTPETLPVAIPVDGGRIQAASSDPRAVRPEDRTVQVVPPVRNVRPPETREPERQRQLVEVTPANQGGGVVTSNQQVGPAEPQQENPFIQLIRQQADVVVARTSPPQSLQEAFDDGQSGEGDDVSAFASDEFLAGFEAAGGNGSGGQGGAGAAEREPPIIRAGDILYAEMLNSVSSDAPMTVLAEVTVGEFRGARLVGAFAVDDAYQGLVVQFNSMTLRDGTQYAISSYAVDGLTAEASVKSDINRRLLQRYGPLLAAAFIQGFAESVATIGTTQTVTGDNVVVTNPEASTRQSIAAGVGTAAGTIASDVGANRVTTPRVNLRRGHPLAVLFIESVDKAPEPEPEVDATPPAISAFQGQTP